MNPTRRTSRPVLTIVEAETLLTAPKDARLATPNWQIEQTRGGATVLARLDLDVTTDQHTLVMTAEWTGPERQQVRLHLPGTSWNVCRLCLSRHHDDIHWHCLDRYNPALRRTTPADLPRSPYAIDQMIDLFAEALQITGITTPLRTWS